MTRPSIDRLCWTVPEVAAALGVSERHVHNCVANGTLPSRRLGRRVLIPVEAVQAWLRGSAA